MRLPLIIADIAAETAEESAEMADFLSFHGETISWQQDWWKILVIAFAALLFIFLLVKLTLYILRMVGVLLCIAFGVVGAYISIVLLNAPLARQLPENAQRFAPVAAAIIGFLVCYLIGALVMAIVRRPAKPASSDKK